MLFDFLITPAYAQAAPGGLVRRRPHVVPADDRDLRRLLFPADPAAAEEGEGNARDARRRCRRATRSSPPAASLGKISKLGDQYVTVEIATGIEINVQRAAVAQLLPKGTIKTL